MGEGAGPGFSCYYDPPPFPTLLWEKLFFTRDREYQYMSLFIISCNQTFCIIKKLFHYVVICVTCYAYTQYSNTESLILVIHILRHYRRYMCYIFKWQIFILCEKVTMCVSYLIEAAAVEYSMQRTDFFHNRIWNICCLKNLNKTYSCRYKGKFTGLQRNPTQYNTNNMFSSPFIQQERILCVIQNI